jgi:K+-sensing histidine kinase KdpD
MTTRLVTDQVKASDVTGQTTRVPVQMEDIDTAKALNLLIHDLRAPLSVAQGYLRLLLQNKLETDAERQRAITQTMEALGRINRLCDDAASYAAEAESGNALPTAVVQVAALTSRVREACMSICPQTITFIEASASSNGHVRAAHIDRIAQSLAVILCAARRSSRDPSIRVSVHDHGNEARFLLGCDDDRAALESRPAEMFDPWRGGHGLALPLACRVVTDAGGRIWTVANARGVVGIALPEEVPIP